MAPEEDTLPEYDFSNGVRGVFAGRWTEEQKAQILRDSIEGSARAWHEFAAKRVQTLESALFGYLVLAAAPYRPANLSALSADAPPFSTLAELIAALRRCTRFGAELDSRFEALEVEARWAAAYGAEGAEGTPAQRLAHMERLERIGREAEALAAAVEKLVQEHLARSGMSQQEIERKTEETAKLWLAA